MKKRFYGIVAAALALGLLAGCGAGGGFDPDNEITGVAREDGSGTRGAFVELTGVERKNAAGEREDFTTVEAVTVSGTSIVMGTVSGDPYAIGYISLGSLNDTVKALSIDGVAPSAQSIKDGSYTLARPFNLVTRPDVSDAAREFIDYIMSTEGQAVVEQNGFVSPLDETKPYDGDRISGRVVVAGSSSVTPVMEKLKEAYAVVNPNAEVEIQMSDSSTGISSVESGICDIGMVSRELTGNEQAKGFVVTVIALDGIVVIVNRENPQQDLGMETLQGIYTGEITRWSEVEAA